MKTKNPRKPPDPVKQFNAWMKNHLRRMFFSYWERTKAIQAARVDRGLYMCASCKKVGKMLGYHVDHIDPVVDPKVGFADWDVYIARLFCSSDNLQLLCEECHKIKTDKEREQRKLHKTGIYSVERAKKISEAKTGVTCYTRPVVGHSLITGSVRFFSSAKEAAEVLGIGASHVSEVCTDKRKHVGGWDFHYA